MTGTAMTEAAEFWKIYKLDVIAIPTNRPLRRINNPDVIYRTEREKFNAIADEIERMHKWDVLVERERRGVPRARSSSETDDAIEFQPQGQQGPARRSPRARSTRSSAAAGRSWSAPCRSRRASCSRGMLEQARHPARGAQRQAPPARGRDRRPGRPQGRRDHRHEHGRPRHRHHPRRQSRDHGLGPAPGQVPHPARRAAGRMGRAGRRDRTARADEGRGPRGGRAWAACTSSAPSGTRPAASTCSFAAAAAARATPAAAASTSRWKTT